NISDERWSDLNVTKVTREALFTESDTVSIHLRHSARTHGFIGKTDLERLGSTGYIVNTSRAEIIDQDALHDALDNNVIAGLATDVFDVEPAQQTHWTVSHPKVLATPHIGYCTNETFEVFYGQMLEAFQAFYNGKPIRLIEPG
ncbi:unnamed protein product, partial [Hapterophycus canaliculatus]